MKSLYKNKIIGFISFFGATLGLILSMFVVGNLPILKVIIPMMGIFYIYFFNTFCLIFISIYRLLKNNKNNLNVPIKELMTIKELSRALKVSPFDAYILADIVWRFPTDYITLKGSIFKYKSEIPQTEQYIKTIYNCKKLLSD
jgi:hypothetical protein